MFISKRKHEKLLQEEVYKTENRIREEFYHQENHERINSELYKLQEKVTKLERMLGPTEDCSCGCNEKTAQTR